MKRDSSFFLDDILENINLIEESLSKLNKKEFLKDRMVQDATIRRLEVIGESAKNIQQNVKEKYPEVEWKKIVGTRDRIIHAYFITDLDIIWNIIKRDIPKLKKQIEKIKEELKHES
jgi:uncharacterized protein with HEPN domain